MRTQPKLFADTINGKFDMTWEDVLDQVREYPSFSDPDDLFVVSESGDEYTGQEVLDILGLKNECEE